MSILAAAWSWCVAKFGRWIVGVCAVAAALAAALLIAFVKGEHRQAAKDTAKDAEARQRTAQEAAAAVQRSADAVRATNDEISKMPDVGTQTVGDAAPDTAAGWLRAHADRDQTGP